MRNKIKQLLRKEGGFTLVELLAVLVILGLIVAIAVPSIGNVVDGAKIKSANAQIELIEDAARLYDIENVLTDDTTIQQLIAAGFLDNNDIKDIKLEGITAESTISAVRAKKVEESKQ